MPVVRLIHGFNVADGGKSTVNRLRGHFEALGFDVEVFAYGWIGPMGVWFLNPRIVKQLLSLVRPGDVGVGHSNGCVLLHMAAHFGAPFKGFEYINPALDSNVPPAPQLEWVHVYFNDGDMVVKFAAWLRSLMPWAPLGDPIWGDMGARGYQPGRYDQTKYVPRGALNRLIHSLNLACMKWPALLWVFRLIFGLPFGFLYLLIFAPIEVLLTLYHNNIRGLLPEMALSLKRMEDARFIIAGLIFPVVVWLVVLAWWL